MEALQGEAFERRYLAYGPHYRQPTRRNHHKRSIIQEDPLLDDGLEIENMLTSVIRLDRDKCVMKLLCQLDNKAANDRSLEEIVLLQVFSNNPETLASYNSALLAAEEHGQNLEQATCDQVFSRCAMSQDELNNLLQYSKGCGNNLVV